MACCEGDQQTRQLTIIIAWRPTTQPDREFRLRINAHGEDGFWRGRAEGRFDHGNAIHCDRAEPGLLNISAKIELTCGGTLDKPVITGEIVATAGSSRYVTRLKQIPLKCFNGGPGCSATWPMVFITGLGNASVKLRSGGRTEEQEELDESQPPSEG